MPPKLVPDAVTRNVTTAASRERVPRDVLGDRDRERGAERAEQRQARDDSIRPAGATAAMADRSPAPSPKAM